MDDSGFAEAVCQLEDDVAAAAGRAESVLSNAEIATELRRIADEIEAEG